MVGQSRRSKSLLVHSSVNISDLAASALRIVACEPIALMKRHPEAAVSAKLQLPHLIVTLIRKLTKIFVIGKFCYKERVRFALLGSLHSQAGKTTNEMTGASKSGAADIP